MEFLVVNFVHIKFKFFRSEIFEILKNAHLVHGQASCIASFTGSRVKGRH